MHKRAITGFVAVVALIACIGGRPFDAMRLRALHLGAVFRYSFRLSPSKPFGTRIRICKGAPRIFPEFCLLAGDHMEKHIFPHGLIAILCIDVV